MRFYEGVVDLCLQAAVKCDPQGLALHFYRNGEPHGDVQGEEAFLARYAPPPKKQQQQQQQTNKQSNTVRPILVPKPVK